MKSLATKLTRILKKVDGNVSKSGFNDHQKYQYIMESDLLEAVRKDIANEGIFIFSSVESVTKQDSITTVHVKNTFVDSETGETFEVMSAGQGADKQDKGVYKALTGAYKYFVMKNFMMSGDNDPEKSEKPITKSNYNKTKSVKSKPATFNKSSSSFGKKPETKNSFSKVMNKLPKVKQEKPEEVQMAVEDIPFL